MRRRYLFFDYDGTLASHEVVPPSALLAIRRLQEAGHLVSLATGRLQASAARLAAPTGIDTFVADGGCSVTIAGDIKWMVGMPLEPCRKLLHSLDAQGWPWAVTTRNELTRFTPSADFPEILPSSYMETQVVPDLEIDALTCIYKIFVPCTPAEERGIDFFGVPRARYNHQSVYCEPTDKAVGIRRMMEILHAPLEDVIVFGDGSNDVSMFLPEWTCVAMGNAIGQLKECADMVTADVDHDGVLIACEKLGLI